MSTRSRSLSASLLICLAACGGGGGDGGGSATQVPPPSSSSSSSSSSSGSSSSGGTTTGGPFNRRANIASCDPGELKNSERQAVLDKLNEIRARHGLLAVTYEAAHDAAAAEAALYMVANRGLTHTPSSSGLCYSANAYSLASTSNLHLAWKSGGSNYDALASTSSLVGFLIDDDVPSLGHRRWMLDPFLGKTTYGRVDGVPSGTSNVYSSSVLKVVGNGRGNVSAMANDYVAYPQGNYPTVEFGKSWFLSFSAIASKTSAGANGGGQVNYSTATVTVAGPGGTLGISEQSADYNGYGIANNLQWKVAGLQDNVTYNVTIANVVVNGSPRTYSYSFRLQ